MLQNGLGLIPRMDYGVGFAVEIFHDLHEEVMATSGRGHGLMIRVQQLEVEFPSIEKTFLSQTNHTSFFSITSTEWHPNLCMEQNLITREDSPRYVMALMKNARVHQDYFL